MNMYSTCRSCGRQYHIAGCCLCQLPEYWRRNAIEHSRAAAIAEETAKQCQEELDLDNAKRAAQAKEKKG